MCKLFMANYFNLDGYLVYESPEGNGWVQWVETRDGSLDCLIGDIKVDKDIDVTVLNHFRDRTGESRYKSLKEAKKYLDSLPKWRKTRYYSRITELGSSGLLDCKTGDMIDSGFEYHLQPHLMIKNNNTGTEQKCPLCGHRFQSRVPVALFLFDLTSHSPFRPVCNRCGDEYAPALANLVRLYYDREKAATGFKIQD